MENNVIAIHLHDLSKTFGRRKKSVQAVKKYIIASSPPR